MNNPWKKIDLNVYEAHMSSDEVFQLQTLNKITKQQLNDYKSTYVAILGISGGNGLENIDISRTKKVYGIDVNQKYLNVCKDRHPQLADILELNCCDLNNINTILPFSDILICNLIIEYLGENKFAELISKNKARVNVLSCVIQRNNNNAFVSSSNLATAFEPILSIHNDIYEDKLISAMKKIGFDSIKNTVYPLPNGKEFIRLDFRKGPNQS